MPMRSVLRYLILLFFFVPLFIQAQTDTTKTPLNLEELDLQELLNVNVSTVSKRKQSASEAPAIVSVITEEQIKSIGATSLLQVMSFVPGFKVSDTYWKRGMITARGVNETNYNDKILMLINDIPAYDAAAMEYYLDVIPVSAIKRVEIIRGPGSTLYGTNAFTAVINVITKNGKDDKGMDAWVRGNSNKMGEANVCYGNSKNDFSYLVSGSVIHDPGYTKKNVPDEGGKLANLRYRYGNYNFFGQVKYKSFTIDAGGMKQDYFKIGVGPTHSYGALSKSDSGGMTFNHKYYVNGIFNKNITDKLTLKVTGHFDYFDSWVNVGNFGILKFTKSLNPVDTPLVDPSYLRATGTVLQGGTQVSYKLNSNTNVMVGATIEQRTTSHELDLYRGYHKDFLYGGSTLDSANVKHPIVVVDYGAFVQLDGKITRKLGYIGGIRYTYLGISQKENLAPRAGLVYSFSENSSLKLLYGSAFRGAGPQEQYYLVPALVYGADAVHKRLKPERIHTTELGWEQQFARKYKLKVNGFYTTVYDLITRRQPTGVEISDYNSTHTTPFTTSTRLYDNLGQLTEHGFEAEIAGYPTKWFSFWANMSYKSGNFKTKVIDPSNTAVLKDTTYNFLPYSQKVTYNLGLSAKLFNKKLNIAPNFQWVGSNIGVLEFNGTTVKNNSTTFKVGAYGLLNLTISYEITKNFKLSVYGTNLADKVYYYPELVRKKLQTIPGGPGRIIGMTLFVKI
jgi:outer membrane receptor for ferrienterochelin and colicins